MNTRINELLENTGLEQLVLKEDLDQYQLSDWNFSGFDMYKNTELKRSTGYFNDILITKSI